jgi:hypothetical protein
MGGPPEWRGAVILMAALADRDRTRLRLATTRRMEEPPPG